MFDIIYLNRGMKIFHSVFVFPIHVQEHSLCVELAQFVVLFCFLYHSAGVLPRKR